MNSSLVWNDHPLSGSSELLSGDNTPDFMVVELLSTNCPISLDRSGGIPNIRVLRSTATDGHTTVYVALFSAGRMILTIPDIIQKKRDRGEMLTEEINHFIKNVVAGTTTEAQIGAWLMAVYLNGMSDRETADLTKAMALTGECLQYKPEWRHLMVDKHSTGGIGDKISLILAPALASLGLKVPMISGRGLDITGGTLDKLESIPGFQVQMTGEQMCDCLDQVGCFIAGQTDSFAPADRILYRIRDVTSTVPSLPLIISSILSKKAAEGIRNLVMDIKVGCGAWIENEKCGTDLALKMIDISKHLNMETSCVLSDMNTPLGRCVGNSLEVIESVECLRNAGSEDVKNLVNTLGGVLLYKRGVATSIQCGEMIMEDALKSGRALKKFREMLLKQGVAEEIVDNLCKGNYSRVLPKSSFITRYSAHKSGVISAISASNIGKACWLLSAATTSRESLDYSVGVKLLKLVTEDIQKGEDWIEVHHNEEPVNKQLQDLIQGSLTIESPGTQMGKFKRILKII